MKRTLAIILALVMVFGLCACGAQPATPAAEEAPVEKPAAPANATEVTAVAVEDAVVATAEESLSEDYDATPADWGTKYEETIVFGYASDCPSPEPGSDSSTQLQLVDNLIYRGLTSFDQVKGVLENKLATSFEANEDCTVWTYKLREGVKFHDGTTFDADDVIFSFERIVDGEQVKVPDSNIASKLDYIEKVDDMTVAFHLLYPVFDLPYMTGQAILSKDAFDSGMENPSYIGCGPYKWIGNEIGVSYNMEAFEDYFEGCPRSHYITFKVMPEIDSQIAALQTGEINFMTAVRATDVPILDADDSVTYVTHGGGTIYFLAWNGGREYPEGLREAVDMAFDKDSANLAMFSGYADLTNSMVGNSCSPDFAEVDNPYKYDVEGAKALLADKGIDPSTITLTAMYYAWCKPIAEVFQASCAEIGITVEMNEIDGSVYRAICEEGEYDVTMTYCGTNSSCLYMTNRFFAADGGGNWWGYVPSAEIEAQNAKCTECTTLEDLLVESAKLQQLCAEDPGYIPFCMAPLFFGMTSNLLGYKDVFKTNNLDYSTCYILK